MALTQHLQPAMHTSPPPPPSPTAVGNSGWSWMEKPEPWVGPGQVPAWSAPNEPAHSECP